MCLRIRLQRAKVKFPRVSLHQAVDPRKNRDVAYPPYPAHTHTLTHASVNAWEVCWGSAMIAQTPIATSPLIWPFRESTLWWGGKNSLPVCSFSALFSTWSFNKRPFFLNQWKKSNNPVYVLSALLQVTAVGKINNCCAHVWSVCLLLKETKMSKWCTGKVFNKTINRFHFHLIESFL